MCLKRFLLLPLSTTFRTKCFSHKFSVATFTREINWKRSLAFFFFSRAGFSVFYFFSRVGEKVQNEEEGERNEMLMFSMWRILHNKLWLINRRINETSRRLFKWRENLCNFYEEISQHFQGIKRKFERFFMWICLEVIFQCTCALIKYKYERLQS